jgi:hypothetical protein
MEETTTEVISQDTGAETAQPVVADTTTAVTTTDESEQQTNTEQTEQVQTQTATQADDDALTKFAQAKGLELDSDSTRKAVKMAMDAEKRMHQATGRASEVEKTLSTMSDQSAVAEAQATGQDPELLKAVRQLQVNNSIRDFFDANPDAREYEAEMSKIATESGLYGTADSILKASYAIALSNDPSKLASVKSQVKQETLQNLAHKQQAAVPTGNATTQTGGSQEKPFAELSISEMEKKLGFGVR